MSSDPGMELRPFAANHMPLDPGVRLLEASAGTGKTFALAQLVLRLVGEAGHTLRELVVVTYTEAAAAELRDRIGRRLQQALAGLDDRANGGIRGWQPPDPILGEWLDSLTSIGTVRGRLLLALEQLDGADITTIHGFCRRTLQRQALEAGQTPLLQLDDNPAGLIEQVGHDYWQRQLLPLPAPLLAGLRHQGLTLANLHQLLSRIDSDPALRLDPLPEELSLEVPLPEALPALWQRRWATLHQQWQERGEALDNDLRSAAAQWRALGANKTGDYSPKPRKNRHGELENWFQSQGESAPYDQVLAQTLLTQFFHPGGFCRVARSWESAEGGDPSLPQAPLMHAIAAAVEGPTEAVLLHAAHWTSRELRRRRQGRSHQSFSDLLEGLDPGAAATAPTALLAAVGARYRVALVDEFQDTDPIQWRILRWAFGLGHHLLVMVGDPKQAIYRFRGGDLATYLQARRWAVERYALGENRRSTPALIEALNGLMAPGLGRSGLAVPPVVARAERHGPLEPPIELLWIGDLAGGPAPPSKTELERRLPDPIATYAATLLKRNLELEIGGVRRPLRPEDLCLLVRTHGQADQLRSALERVGLASRLVSKADVFASPAAHALQRLLDALADPADPNRLRLLAASPLLGWTARQLAEADPNQWSRLAGELAELASQLPQIGLLGVLAVRLGSESLSRLALGGRLLADLQQVAELVEERLHAEHLGPAAAAAWLRRLRLEEDREVPEAHQVHSDRSDGALSVVTVHRSKGLEYPVVICPYLWQAAGSRRGGRLRPGVRWHPPGAADPTLDLHLNSDWGPGWAAADQANAAEAAEQERLAYVALTRAQHLLVLAWGPAQDQQHNPLQPWLFPHQAPNEDDPVAVWRAALEQSMDDRGLAIRVLDPAPVAMEPTPVSPPPPEAPPLSTGPVPQRPLRSRWGRSSYTSWTRSVHGASPEALEEGRDIDDPGAESPEEPRGDWPDQGPLGDFPRGATAGDCLHRILEHLDYTTPLPETTTQQLVERELRRAGLQEQPLAPVVAGLELTLTTPCGGPLGALTLAQLPRNQRLNEMNFDLTLGLAKAERLAAAFIDHPGGAFGAAYGRRVAQLPVASEGFLTGSIDLVFQAPDPQGQMRWWVLDWKSNWLGQRDPDGRPRRCGPSHYHPMAMEQLMAERHYPLQAHLYLVALHRYLAWRLPDYTPEQHLGGYVYVFLRGTPGPSGARALPGNVPGMVVEQPPLGRLLALDRALEVGP